MDGRRRRRRGQGALALVASLALIAASCGGGEEGAAERSPGPLSGELSVVINWTGSELEAFQAVIDGFTSANPGVKVQLDQIPFEELNAQLTQRFAAGSPPDVTVVLPGLIRQLSEQDMLVPLDSLWDRWVADGQYTQSLRDIATFGGHTYGVWFKGNVNALIWYRPDVLEQLGADVPTTWDEFTAVLDEAKAQGLEPFAVGGADQWPLTQWSDAVLLRVAGAEAFNALARGEISWDDSRVVEAFEVLADLMSRYFPSNVLDRGFIDEVCAWADGRALFINQGAFVNLIAPAECNPDLVPGEDFTFFLMPKFDESAPDAQFVSGDLFAVAKDTDNLDAALALVEYLGSAEAQAIWAERGGFVAPNTKVPLDVYPNENDVKAAQLWPRDPATQAGYDLDDFIGGEIQATEREALQQLARDHDVARFIATMTQVDTRAGG